MRTQYWFIDMQRFATKLGLPLSLISTGREENMCKCRLVPFTNFCYMRRYYL